MPFDGRSDGNGLCLLFFDLDYFKKVNDTYGHAFGDEVLIRFAGILKGSTRPADLYCRHGGEEFLLAIPGGDAAEGVTVGKRIMRAVKEVRFASNPDFRFSVSIGLEAGVPEAGDTLNGMIKRADMALYEAKRQGRDRIVRYDDIPKSCLATASGETKCSA